MGNTNATIHVRGPVSVQRSSPKIRPRSPRRSAPSLAPTRNPSTVKRILDAAEQIFAERGLAGARTGAIARAARVNNALLYYYFRSKEELHRVTLETLFGQLRTQVGAALDAPGSPREKLLSYINAYFDFVVAHPNYPRLFQRELMGPGTGSRLRGIVRDNFRPLHLRLAATIRSGIAQGDFRRVDPEHTVLTMVAMTVFYFAAAPVLAELWQCDPLAPQRVAARRRSIVDFLEYALFLRPARRR